MESLEVSVKQVAGGRLQGNFTIEEQMERPKVTIAYDIAIWILPSRQSV